MKTKEEKYQLLQSLKTLLRKNFGDNIQDIILFGSQAKGTATEFSHYDILIILKNDYDKKNRKKISQIMYDLELKYDVLFDEHLLSQNDIKNTLKGTEPIYVTALQKGIYL